MKFLDLLRLGFKPVCILLCNLEVFMFSFRFRPEMNINSSWNSPGENTWVSSLSLLQGIIPTQGSNPGLPHYRRILYQLRHKRSPRILEWVAYPFSNGSSQPRNLTTVSYTAGRFFANWAMREALYLLGLLKIAFFPLHYRQGEVPVAHHYFTVSYLCFKRLWISKIFPNTAG